MATFILTSHMSTTIKDSTGKRIVVPVENTNFILTMIKFLAPSYGTMVFVANDPDNYHETDLLSKTFFESFDKAGLVFNNKIVLDNRNRDNAGYLIEHADLIIFCGGNTPRQNDFFWQVRMKELLKNSAGVAIGISAGAMNLCEKTFALPESLMQLADDRWLDGLGFFNKIIVPHFDGRRMRPYKGIDVDEFVYKRSYGQELIGFTNDSYILINGETIKYFGTFYSIKDGKVTQACF